MPESVAGGLPLKHLLHVFSTFAPGGPQVRTARLLTALAAEGWRHTICAMDGCTEARDLLGEEVDVRFVDPPSKKGAVGSVRGLRALLSDLRPDLLLTYNWGAIEAVLASRFARSMRVLHHEDGFRPDEVDGFKRRRVWTRRLALRGVERVIVPSLTLEGIARSLWRLSSERVHYIPNGIRVADFELSDGNAPLRRELAIPEQAFVVGSVGHLRAEKNPARLIRSLVPFQDAHVLMLGDGPERAVVERTAREAGMTERVHLVGHREQTAGFYRAMDVFALSSDTEQMPVALLEAMASGLAVASTDVGDVAQMLGEDQRPFVVALGEGAGERLGRALEELRRDPQRRKRLGGANLERARALYSFEAMVAAYRAEYLGSTQDRSNARG